MTPRSDVKLGSKLSAVLVLSILIAVGVFAYRSISSFDICDTRVERRITSPDGKWVAVVFHRDCGATVDFNTHVSLVPAGKVFSFHGYPPAYSGGGDAALTVSWLAANRLQIGLPLGEKVYRRDRAADGIAIVYR
jgi:hypothetical protein